MQPEGEHCVGSEHPILCCRCVLDTQPRSFSVNEVAIICNFSELIMRILEGQVMQQRPQSSVLSGEHSRGAGAYHQAYAAVDAAEEGWPILASTTAFDEMTGPFSPTITVHEAAKPANISWLVLATSVSLTHTLTSSSQHLLPAWRCVLLLKSAASCWD